MERIPTTYYAAGVHYDAHPEEEKSSAHSIANQERTAASSFVPCGLYADSSLPTFVLAMYLNQTPVRAERDLVFVRHLSSIITHLTAAAADSEGLEALRKLLWWNLAPIPPFAICAFTIQQLCITIAKLSNNSPARIFTAKHPLTRGPQLPKWQHNPAWIPYLSGPHQGEHHKDLSSALIVEYTLCLHGVLHILDSFLKKDFDLDIQVEGHTSKEATHSESKNKNSLTPEAPLFDFGDPGVTIFNSPGIFVSEACTSTLEISHVLVSTYPWAADKIQEATTFVLATSGVIDIYPERFKMTIDRIQGTNRGELGTVKTKLRPTAKEFCPAVKQESSIAMGSLSASAARAPVFVPQKYPGARPPALHIDDFEAIYGKG